MKLNFWLKDWAEKSDKYTIDENLYHFYIWALYANGYAIFSGLRVFAFLLNNVKAVKRVHREMISRILNAPINNYFDRVP